MSKRTRPVQTVSVEVNRLRGKRKGASIKEQVWFEDGEVVAYNLAYINLKQCRFDHGRVLGYDNSHSFHHRHFMGKVVAIEYASYEALLERFIREVHELWSIEDAED